MRILLRNYLKVPDKIKIIFFIESLRSGGKERRLIELLSYLKDKPEYELMVVLVEKKIYYKKFLDMKIPFVFIERKTIKKDPRPFFSFYGLCRQFKPDMVHVWGRMNAIYALPTIIFQKIPLINGQITSAPPNLKKISLKVLSDGSYLNLVISLLPGRFCGRCRSV